MADDSAALEASSVIVPSSRRHTPEYSSTHIGASQWSIACGAYPWRTAIELWQEFQGTIDKFEGNEATELGHDLEAGVLRAASRKLKQRFAHCETIEHPDHRENCTTPDGYGESGDLCQVKVTGMVDAWGEPLTDHVPEHTLIQVTGELFIARAAFRDRAVRALAAPELGMVPNRIPERCHVAALMPGAGFSRALDVSIFTVEWDEELAAALFSRVSDFWACVKAKRPPPPDHTGAFSTYLAKRFPDHKKGEWKTADLEAMLVLTRYREHAELEERHGNERAKAGNELRAIIGEAEGLKGDWGQLPWRTKRGKGRVDDMRLAAHLGAMLAQRTGPATVEAARDIATRIRDITARHMRVDFAGVVEDLRTELRGTKMLVKDLDAMEEQFTTRGEPGRSFGPVTWKDKA